MYNEYIIDHNLKTLLYSEHFPVYKIQKLFYHQFLRQLIKHKEI